MGEGAATTDLKCQRCERTSATVVFRAKNGATCRDCERARAHAYYHAHRDEIAAQQGDYRRRYAPQIDAQQKAWRAQNEDRVRETGRAWKAANPEKVKANAAASRARNRRTVNAKGRARWAGATPEDKEARRRYKQEWRERNREKVRATERARYAIRVAQERARRRPRERMRAFGHDDDARGYAAVVRGDPCTYCGASADAVDHIVALVNGGPNSWDNLTATCRSCNSSKNDLALLTFLGRRWAREQR